MLVSARSFADYRAMFALTDRDLEQRILDCPAGAASFVAEAGRRGVDAVAVDREYAFHREELGLLVELETRFKRPALVREAADFVWSWYADPDELVCQWIANARLFRADIAARPERYLAGELPELPFADGSFDLVLCSHLLFSYGNRLGEDFLRAGLLELARVARSEVRVFPVTVYDTGERHPGLDRLREDLDGLGIGSRVERVAYEFQPGSDELLVLSCAGYRAPARTAPCGTAAVDPVRWRHRERGA
ncbi:methyltransferase domain-containing protein [Streptomyces sp. FH025]|uniref:methyltransferase domain-containing protein n=1 Tax=Streptomyces sp. FH025 TaxID=2815937 RepID=UPI001A9D7B77|nr:methyltransferase domain-containing protein [Streptomyces sp. FH025]MBO1413490.1 methyltransferase domain-containing protein [Streptomyces sp. FH025]